MCGLVGIVGDPYLKMLNAFEDMLRIDTLRGEHSTGVVIMQEKDLKWQYLKDTVLPTQLFQSDIYKKMCKENSAHIHNSLYMGHNRFATKGKITVGNAHPFQHGHVILMHNGTVHDYKSLSDKEYETDSETICRSIHKNGIEKTWKNLKGAAALSFLNTHSGYLHLIRNAQRPLWIGRTKDGKHIFYASESWMIYAAAMRRHFNLESVEELKPNVLVSFFWSKEKRKIIEKEKELEPFRYSYVNNEKRTFNSGGIWGGYDDPYSQPWQDWGRKKSVSPSNSSSSEPHLPHVSDINMTEPRRHYKKRFKDHTEFEEKYPWCGYCGRDMQGEFEDCVIVDENIAVCDECVTTIEFYGFDPNMNISVN